MEVIIGFVFGGLLAILVLIIMATAFYVQSESGEPMRQTINEHRLLGTYSVTHIPVRRLEDRLLENQQQHELEESQRRFAKAMEESPYEEDSSVLIAVVGLCSFLFGYMLKWAEISWPGW